MDADAQIESDPSEPGTLSEQPKPLVMPVWIYRLIGINACVMYLVNAGALVIESAFSNPSPLWSMSTFVTAVSIGLLVLTVVHVVRSYFVPALSGGGWVLWMLAIPLVGLILSEAIGRIGRRQLDLNFANLFDNLFGSIVVAIGWTILTVVLCCYPLQVVHGAIRKSKSAQARYPYDFIRHERWDALFFVCVMSLASVVYWGIALREIYSLITVQWSSFYTTSEVFGYAAVFAVGAMFLGMIISIIVGSLLQHTNLHKSVVYTFRWPIVLGLLCSVFSMGWGVILTGVAVLVLAAISKSKFKLHPLGHCQSCGYSLAGLETNQCPECGQIDKQQQHLVRS
tara:strand:- start:24860 stop:25879 length:1020 start_codon:yes stop_codon:yes gene_type:complete